MTNSTDEVGPRNLLITLASELHTMLSQVPVGSEFIVPPSSDLCDSLELFIPSVLRTQHPEWHRESLDGIFVGRARRAAPGSAELIGTCILISDQTVTPLLLTLQLSSAGRSIDSYRVCIGEPGGGPLGISGPACNSREARELLDTIASRADRVAWSYHVAGTVS